jgi:hypothetical protein
MMQLHFCVFIPVCEVLALQKYLYIAQWTYKATSMAFCFGVQTKPHNLPPSIGTQFDCASTQYLEGPRASQANLFLTRWCHHARHQAWHKERQIYDTCPTRLRVESLEAVFGLQQYRGYATLIKMSIASMIQSSTNIQTVIYFVA